MKDFDTARKQDLCDQLNMRFEEANELFGTETLQNMTMAQVNGSNLFRVVGLIVEAATGIVSVIELGFMLYDRWKDDEEPTPALDSLTTNGTPGFDIRTEGGVVTLNGVPADSLNLNTSKNQVEIYFRGFTYGQGPTTP